MKKDDRYYDTIDKARWLISAGYPVPTTDPIALTLLILENEDIINNRNKPEGVTSTS